MGRLSIDSTYTVSSHLATAALSMTSGDSVDLDFPIVYMKVRKVFVVCQIGKKIRQSNSQEQMFGWFITEGVVMKEYSYLGDKLVLDPGLYKYHELALKSLVQKSIILRIIVKLRTSCLDRLDPEREAMLVQMQIFATNRKFRGDEITGRISNKIDKRG